MNPTVRQAREDLARGGTLRAAINFGNPVLAQKNPKSGEAQGVSVDLALELARRFDVPIELVTFDSAGKVFSALTSDAWDVAFLAIDPVRATEILFTSPYVIIEGTYLVRAESPMSSIADFDRPGVRIAVGRGAAYDLFLTRELKHAELVRAPTSSDAIELFLSESLDAVAGVRQPLAGYAAAHSGLRVIDGHFTTIRQAMGTPKGREIGVRYLEQFIEEMKASGFVAKALAKSGQGDAAVAPPSAEQ